jgi:hypothetical protein
MADLDLELIISMWNAGKSSKEIGRHFGVTKNVIIGKVHRARLKGIYVKSKPNPAKPKPVPFKKPKVASKSQLILKLVQEDQPMKEGLAIYDLEPNQCKYSVGESETGEYLFCGKEHTNVAYCDMHHQICHSKPVKKEQISRRDYKNKFLRVW